MKRAQAIAPFMKITPLNKGNHHIREVAEYDLTTLDRLDISMKYRVTFCDRTTQDVDAGHSFLTQTAADRMKKVKSLELQARGNRQRDWEPLPDRSRPGTVKTIEAIADTLVVRPGPNERANHSIIPALVEYGHSPEFVISPYTMGFLLGDGCFRHPQGLSFSTLDLEIVEWLRNELPEDSNHVIKKKPGDNCDWRIQSTVKGYHTRSSPHTYRTELKRLGLNDLYSHEKFVPGTYMTASAGDRLAILQGLMDSDGNANKIGNSVKAEFSCTSENLTKSVATLTRSLGGYAIMGNPRIPKYKNKHGDTVKGKEAYRVSVRLPIHLKPFRLARKLAKWSPPELRRLKVYIKNVERIGD